MATELKVIEGGDSAVGGERWAEEIRREAKDLAGRVDTDYIKLAQKLYQIYDTPVDGDEKNSAIWTKWGYSSYASYVQEELGIHKKRAQRLKRIWHCTETLKEEGLDEGVRQRLIELGFSKIRELVRVVNVKNAEKWVTKAEELSYPHLTQVVRDTLDIAEKRDRAVRETGRDRMTDAENAEPGEGTEDSGEPSEVSFEEETEADVMVPDADISADDMKRLNFMAYADQADTINDALERAAQISGSSIKTNNLALICMDFIATNDFAKATTNQKLRFIAKLEQSLGYKLVAFDGEDVVYGIGTLKSAAEAE